jgi:uncharacterized protein (UPF0332 family)
VKEETRQLVEKAERALQAAQTLLDTGDAEFSAGRVYYAMLYGAQALLRESDLQFGKHSGVHAAFGQHFAKTGVLDPKYHRWLLDAFDERLQGDYGFQAQVNRQAVATRLEQAREFLGEIRRYLEGGTQPTREGHPEKEE